MAARIVPLLRTALLAALAALPAALPAAELSAAAARGKQIFHSGTRLSGVEITAYVGQASVPIGAATLPCRACHGIDGRGRPEGGVIPSDIRWSHLTKPYGSSSASGRRFPPYDEAALGVAVRAGRDPAGTALDTAMPRYDLGDEDLADLAAYLREIESDVDPGIHEDRVVVGTVVPRGGEGGLGDAVRRVLSAYFQDVNGAGGIYGRKLELVAGAADSPPAAVSRGRQLIEEIGAFALLGAVTAGAESEFAALVEERKVPLVAPLAQFAEVGDGTERYQFQLLSGAGVQARALLDFAADGLLEGSDGLAIVHGPAPQQERVARLAERHARRSGWSAVERLALGSAAEAEALAADLRGRGAQGVLFLADESSFVAFARSAAEQGWSPRLFLPAAEFGRAVLEAPKAFSGRIYVAFPTLPSDYSEAGRAEFNAFHQRHQLGQAHLATQITTFAGAKLFVEALRQIGRELSRERLIATLERLYRYDTGLTPPISFGVNRRVGALGAHVAAVELEQGGLGEARWVSPGGSPAGRRR